MIIPTRRIKSISKLFRLENIIRGGFIWYQLYSSYGQYGFLLSKIYHRRISQVTLETGVRLVCMYYSTTRSVFQQVFLVVLSSSSFRCNNADQRLTSINELRRISDYPQLLFPMLKSFCSCGRIYYLFLCSKTANRFRRLSICPNPKIDSYLNIHTYKQSAQY